LHSSSSILAQIGVTEACVPKALTEDRRTFLLAAEEAQRNNHVSKTCGIVVS
jgi:hypothetical protein